MLMGVRAIDCTDCRGFGIGKRRLAFVEQSAAMPTVEGQPKWEVTFGSEEKVSSLLQSAQDVIVRTMQIVCKVLVADSGVASWLSSLSTPKIWDERKEELLKASPKKANPSKGAATIAVAIFQIGLQPTACAIVAGAECKEESAMIAVATFQIGLTAIACALVAGVRREAMMKSQITMKTMSPRVNQTTSAGRLENQPFQT